MSRPIIKSHRARAIRQGWVLTFVVAVMAFWLPGLAHAQASDSPYTTGYRWDLARRIVGTISPDPDVNGPLRFAATRYTYNPDGQVTAKENGQLANWAPENVAPSAWADFTIISTTTYEYDAGGRKVKELLSAGGVLQNVTNISYDANDRPTCTAIRMKTSEFASAPPDACLLTNAVVPQDRISQNIYDADGQLIQVRKALKVTGLEQAYVTHHYTPNGKKDVVVDAEGNKAELSYDKYDRQTHWKFPAKGTPPAGFDPTSPATALATAGAASGGSAADYEQYDYDASDNRTALRKRDGWLICQKYDALNRVSAKFFLAPGSAMSLCQTATPTGTDSVHYTYDLRGLQIAAKFGSASGEGITNEYYPSGLLKASTTTMGGTSRKTSHEYDRNGNRTRIIHPNLVDFDYAYDGLNRMKEMSEDGTLLATFTYDSAGRRIGLNRPEINSPTSYSYVQTSLLMRGLGHDLPGTSNDVTHTFDYNPANQMTKRTLINDAYVYNDATAVTRPYVPNGLNQYDSSGTGNNLATYRHDLNGNLDRINAKTPTGTPVTIDYVYDRENRLVSGNSTGADLCEGACGNTATLVYDPLGRLYRTVGSSYGATRFVYDGDALIAEYSDGGTLLRRYVHGPGVDEPIMSDDVYLGRRYFYANHQGSIVAARGTSSTATTSYDAYGIRDGGSAGAAIGRFQYTGQIILPELGFYHYKARVYSPTLGRFLQTDPVGYKDQMNLYAYVENDPVNNLDPNGELIFPLIRLAIQSCAKNATCRGVAVKAGQAIKRGFDRITRRGREEPPKREPPNPFGSKGKPDHQRQVGKQEEIAQKEAGPSETVVREKKASGMDVDRRPDVQTRDETGRTVRVREVERKPDSKAVRDKRADYERNGIQCDVVDCDGNPR